MGTLSGVAMILVLDMTGHEHGKGREYEQVRGDPYQVRWEESDPCN